MLSGQLKGRRNSLSSQPFSILFIFILDIPVISLTSSISQSPRDKPEGNKEERSPSITFIFIVIIRKSRRDVRLKAEHDRKRKEAEHDKENTRHGLTICTQEATRFNKDSRRSQYCGQAGYSLRLRASPCQAGNSLSYAGLTGETIKNAWIRWYFFGLPYFAG